MNIKLPSMSLMPGIAQSMNLPYFWLNKLSFIDLLLISPKQVEELNLQTLQNNLINNIFAQNDAINIGKKTINNYYDLLTKKDSFQQNGSLFSKKTIHSLLNKINWLTNPRLQVINNLADERLMPTSSLMMEKPSDYEFDILQNNALDYGSLCLVLAESHNKKWLFQVNKSTTGWVKEDHLSPLDLCEYMHYRDFIIVTEPYSQLFKDSNCTQYAKTVRMGTLLYYEEELEMAYKIHNHANLKQALYLLKSQAHKGYLPCTLRNIYELAFKYMHTPYGWGDTNGFVDCSKLLQLIFTSFGILLPRNGASQGATGKQIYASDHDSININDKEAYLIKHSIPGITFFRFPGHIMLYIGTHRGAAYVLHCLYKYYDESDSINVVNRVVVSDLSLGYGSEVGSFLERITQANCLYINKFSQP
ncbi:MAG: NlpC/P60 family protein [Candidatus Cloacimonadales bacterium]|nr:SH3 domain-containing protein [Candidatus Cloacimonadota bacterium]MDD2649835.1 NlpC/P60 family protein [Candidatus Cloacimonadota bacterium]MDX9977693.1 NlpC/P60 family protein [Candidatus Cloacimonadales bacterium]